MKQRRETQKTRRVRWFWVLSVLGIAANLWTLGDIALAQTTSCQVGVYDCVGGLYLYSGNVGMGTTVPGATLDVANTTSSTSRGLQITQYTSDILAPQVNLRKARGTLTAPSAVLSGDVIFNLLGRAYDSSSFGNASRIRSFAAQNWNATSHGSNIAFDTVPIGGTSMVERMRIEASGYVGIGTTTPGYTLDVAGSAHATSFPTSSDFRLKTNITQLTGVLDKLQKIRGVAFDWNKRYASLGRSTGHREIGVVAQEVEAVFPELVTHWGTESYRAVDYGRLTAVLIEAIKELKAEKDALEAALKAQETELEVKMKSLEAQLNERTTIPTHALGPAQ